MDFAEQWGRGVVGSATHRVTEPRRGACPAPTPAWDAVRSKEQGQGKPSLQLVLPHAVPFVLCLQPTGLVESGDNQLLPSPWCRLESDAERLGLASVPPVGTWGSRAAHWGVIQHLELNHTDAPQLSAALLGLRCKQDAGVICPGAGCQLGGLLLSLLGEPFYSSATCVGWGHKWFPPGEPGGKRG